MSRATSTLAVAGVLLAAACSSPESDPDIAARTLDRPAPPNCAVSLWPTYVGQEITTVDVKTGGPDRVRTLGSASLAMPDAATLIITPLEPLRQLPEDGNVVSLGELRVRATSSCRHADAGGHVTYVTHPNMTDSMIF